MRDTYVSVRGKQMVNQIGEYLRNLREEKELTTRELGEIVGCSYSLIARFETGERFPKLDRLWQITDKLDGDFGQALFLFCLDVGVPEDVARKATAQDTDKSTK